VLVKLKTAAKSSFATIEIGSTHGRKGVRDGESEVSFQFDLEAGPQRITTTLSEGADSKPENSMGAYYVYAERL